MGVAAKESHMKEANKQLDNSKQLIEKVADGKEAIKAGGGLLLEKTVSKGASNAFKAVVDIADINKKLMSLDFTKAPGLKEYRDIAESVKDKTTTLMNIREDDKTNKQE